MRDAAFADTGAKRRLEAILHPLIGAEAERLAAASSGPLTIFDIPLLVESGRWRGRVDRVWLVDCGEALQIARVMARSGWTESAVRAVVAQQAGRAARRAAADAVIHNDGIGLDELGREVDALWRQTIDMA
jgi:dephospho-CoA kinase